MLSVNIQQVIVVAMFVLESFSLMKRTKYHLQSRQIKQNNSQKKPNGYNSTAVFAMDHTRQTTNETQH
ncbi:hypothetical protein DERP_012648 [Dermatophagoides pteronyssinus]|uniref:Secreted protein n=1 Tax=Dermatophagoides pteronyssinus TaxID=6956 RepID=A0ABQ8IYG8_DERPT|nr:hypothetical protein DERP_012648 [Dermatophagoides pteronyssinus]